MSIPVVHSSLGHSASVWKSVGDFAGHSWTVIKSFGSKITDLFMKIFKYSIDLYKVHPGGVTVVASLAGVLLAGAVTYLAYSVFFGKATPENEELEVQLAQGAIPKLNEKESAFKKIFLNLFYNVDVGDKGKKESFVLCPGRVLLQSAMFAVLEGLEGDENVSKEDFEKHLENKDDAPVAKCENLIRKSYSLCITWMIQNVFGKDGLSSDLTESQLYKDIIKLDEDARQSLLNGFFNATDGGLTPDSTGLVSRLLRVINDVKDYKISKKGRLSLAASLKGKEDLNKPVELKANDWKDIFKYASNRIEKENKKIDKAEQKSK